MSAIETYKRIKNEQRYSVQWAEKLGKRYEGGGGGYGRVTGVILSKCEIYHQFSNGDTNYHSCPELKSYLEKAIMNNFKAMLQEALDLQVIDVSEAAKKAREEFESINKDVLGDL